MWIDFAWFLPNCDWWHFDRLASEEGQMAWFYYFSFLYLHYIYDCIDSYSTMLTCLFRCCWINPKVFRLAWVFLNFTPHMCNTPWHHIHVMMTWNWNANEKVSQNDTCDFATSIFLFEHTKVLNWTASIFSSVVDIIIGACLMPNCPSVRPSAFFQIK